MYAHNVHFIIHFSNSDCFCIDDQCSFWWQKTEQMKSKKAKAGSFTSKNWKSMRCSVCTRLVTHDKAHIGLYTFCCHKWIQNVSTFATISQQNAHAAIITKGNDVKMGLNEILNEISFGCILAGPRRICESWIDHMKHSRNSEQNHSIVSHVSKLNGLCELLTRLTLLLYWHMKLNLKTLKNFKKFLKIKRERRRNLCKLYSFFNTLERFYGRNIKTLNNWRKISAKKLQSAKGIIHFVSIVRWERWKFSFILKWGFFCVVKRVRE